MAERSRCWRRHHRWMRPDRLPWRPRRSTACLRRELIPRVLQLYTPCPSLLGVRLFGNGDGPGVEQLLPHASNCAYRAPLGSTGRATTLDSGRTC